MSTLYLTQQGATLKKEQNRFVVEYEEQRLAEIHEFKLQRVVIFGNVQVSAAAIALLLERGIDTAYLSLYGKLKGRLVSLESKNIELRLRQYERSRDAPFACGIARSLVAAKISNCGELLARHARNHADCDLKAEIEQLDSYRLRAARCVSTEILRGVEGQAAAIYFSAFAKMLRRGLTFNKRSRRPPADPVNSLLSFGYALLYNETIAALVSAGCDAYLGFYHTPRFGRLSLALDVMEEMRPLVVDRLILSLVNREVFKVADFQRGEDGGIYLGDSGRKRFLNEYERAVSTEFTNRRTNARTTLRGALYEQSLAMQHAILQGMDYQPFQGWH